MSRRLLVYVHGFRSSGASSAKAEQLRAHSIASGRAAECELRAPELPSSPNRAMEAVEGIIRGGLQRNQRVTLIGSSLGGFYSTLLVERNKGEGDVRAVLLNPGVFPARDLARFADVPQTMYHDAARPFVFTSQDLAELSKLEQEMSGYVRQGLRGNYLLIACTGDETLDYREMVARYETKHVRVVEGGDHGMSDFMSYIPWIDQFIFKPDLSA